jgi:hypothetical protein
MDEAIDYAELIESFDMEEALETALDCGVAATADFPLELIKDALRNRYIPSVKDAGEIFGQLNVNGTGLGAGEVQKALAILNGDLLDSAVVAEKLKEMDSDGNGQVSEDEFSAWYVAYEKAAEELVEMEWAVSHIQKVQRGRLARSHMKEEHNFVRAASTELQAIEPVVPSHLMYETGNGPSDWLSLDESMDLIMEGIIVDDTLVYSEG